jgi:hypothetical protein
MWMTKISGPAAAVLYAGGLAVAGPEATAAAPVTPATSVAQPPARCLSGVRRVQVTDRHTPSQRVSTVRSGWISFTTSGVGPCPKNGRSASRS